MKISEFTVLKACISDSRDFNVTVPFKPQNNNKFSRTNTKYSVTCLKKPLKNRQNKDLKAMWYLNVD